MSCHFLINSCHFLTLFGVICNPYLSNLQLTNENIVTSQLMLAKNFSTHTKHPGFHLTTRCPLEIAQKTTINHTQQKKLSFVGTKTTEDKGGHPVEALFILSHLSFSPLHCKLYLWSVHAVVQPSFFPHSSS